MAADVSSMVNSSSNSEILITKDLLGGFSNVANKDLDLDLQDTKSWDAPHDFKSAGKVYSQRCYSVSSPLPSFNSKKHHKQRTTQEPEAQDSKLPPLKFWEESCLELKLVPSSHCQSVCTLDKVKSALQRAEKETITKKRSPPPPPNDIEEDNNGTASSSAGVFAAACPGCLLYVIALKTNPRCPSCNSVVPSPSAAAKKPRIDLNASF